MERRDLDEIERFLTSVGQATLFAYYGLDPAADAPAADEAIRKRRGWAQGQQSNPKYKPEALFLIKNNALLKRVFVEDLDAYRALVAGDASSGNLESLSRFIRERLSGGVLTPEIEAAILHEGRALELADTAVTRRLEELIVECGASRAGFEGGDLSADTMAVDHYAVLELPPDAPADAIETAYRSRYRWARNLKDLERSAGILDALDQAWRVLSNPERRARYDASRAEIGGTPRATAPDALDPAARAPDPASPEGSAGGAAPPAHPPAPPITMRVGPAPLPPVGPPPIAPLPIAPAPVAPVRAPDTRAPAPPPGTGRTLGLGAGPQPLATPRPRLVVDGPDAFRAKVGNRPVQQRWIVRNGGQGRMPGRVVSDRDWLSVAMPRLDPNAPNQIVTVTVESDLLPRGKSSGTLTFVTDHGERRTIPVHVERASWLPVVAGVLLVLALALLGIFGGHRLFGASRPATSLALTVAPTADRVLVDGREIGRGTEFQIPDPSGGRAFLLRVEADGFGAHEELVTLRPGERTQRTVELPLRDAMDWRPADPAASVPAPTEVAAAINGAGPALARCFVGLPGPSAMATYTAWVTPDGQVRGLEIADATFPVEPAADCIRSTFRALRLPAFSGDHARVIAILQVEVPR